MSTPRVFDRELLRKRREQASATFGAHDFLLREIAERICERLDDVRRSFPRALIIGAHTGQMAERLRDRFGIETVVEADISVGMLRGRAGLRVAADEEFLPFAPDVFDLVLAPASLHTVNDLAGALIQLRHSLKPDGLLLATVPGAHTLRELRDALLHGEMKVSAGVSPRVAPFMDVRDAGALLQRAGFALPVVDSETVTVRYEHPLKLLHDLRGAGEASALDARSRKPLRRDVFKAMAEYYMRRYAGEDGRIPATFELLTLTAWKPHASQPQPLKRGSGMIHLGDVLE
jgi:NADH dehydrogenase [ubiquinone] 1 alpha subcomplex assembly factor 5